MKLYIYLIAIIIQLNFFKLPLELHTNNQHFVPIVDPGIYALDSSYPAYTEGIDQKVFISAIDNEPYLGQV